MGCCNKTTQPTPVVIDIGLLWKGGRVPIAFPKDQYSVQCQETICFGGIVK